MEHPSLNSKIIGSLTEWESVSVLKTDNKTVVVKNISENWLQIKLNEEQNGWVFSANLTCDLDDKIIF